MISKKDIQEAHDILDEVLEQNERLGLQNRIPEPMMDRIHAARDTLCWVLGHRNGAFAKNLANLKALCDLFAGRKSHSE